MAEKVLVAYASKHGATKEIAERIGDVLRKRGYMAEVKPAQAVSDLGDYRIVIVGAALYIGRWQKEAVTFLKRFEEKLHDTPTWMFVSGPTGEEDPVKQLEGELYPDSLRPLIQSIRPRDIACFGGKIDMDQLRFIEKWMINKSKAPIGDYRNWDAITAWAEGIEEIER